MIGLSNPLLFEEVTLGGVDVEAWALGWIEVVGQMVLLLLI